MNLYLDDDCASRLLVHLLSTAGHDVQRPAMVDLDGASDASHLTHAIGESRVLITANSLDLRKKGQGSHFPAPMFLPVVRDLIKAAGCVISGRAG